MGTVWSIVLDHRERMRACGELDKKRRGQQRLGETAGVRFWAFP